MNDVKQLLRPADLAPLLGVTASRIYQLIGTGALPAVRIGGSIRVPREAWERWLAEQRDRALESVHRS
jgi:excisionase family DNA binding protein